MAFIRRYARQGDPLGAFIRAGVLQSPGIGPRRRGPGFAVSTHPRGFMRSDMLRGDPFLGKMFKKVGKALKKVTLKGAVKAVGNVAKFAAPILLPGVGGALAGAVLGGGGGGQSAPPVVEEFVPAPPAPVATTMPAFDESMFQAMLERWIAQQQAAQAAAEAQMLAQWQAQQMFARPSFTASPWGF